MRAQRQIRKLVLFASSQHLDDLLRSELRHGDGLDWAGLGGVAYPAPFFLRPRLAGILAVAGRGSSCVSLVAGVVGVGCSARVEAEDEAEKPFAGEFGTAVVSSALVVDFPDSRRLPLEELLPKHIVGEASCRLSRDYRANKGKLQICEAAIRLLPCKSRTPDRAATTPV